jgi:hypothetical protein
MVYYFGSYDIDDRAGVNYIDFTHMNTSIELNMEQNKLLIHNQLRNNQTLLDLLTSEEPISMIK